MARGLNRIVWHWTGGGYKPSAEDRAAYHFLIDGDGEIHKGNVPPEANIKIVDGKPYAAHTKGANTGAIGTAICSMRGSMDRPFQWGPSPIRPVQIQSLLELSATLCKDWDIPVTTSTTLSHAEVEPTLKIKQRNKWDIRCLPGDVQLRDAIEVGDELRERLSSLLPTDPWFDFKTPVPSWTWDSFLRFIGHR